MTDTTMLDNRINKQINFEPLEATVAATEEESVILAEKLIPLLLLRGKYNQKENRKQ